MNYLLDTNVIINYFKGLYANTSKNVLDTCINETANISVVTRIELLAWPLLPKQEELIVLDFITDSLVFSLSEEIIKQTIAIKKENKIKLPDAIIAATALTNNLTLLTQNLNDFKNIKSLLVTTPDQL